MKKLLVIVFTFFFSASLYAQQNNNYVELGGGIGSSVGSVNVAFHKNWTLGKKDKFIIGTGIRFTSLFGTDINFTSAPPDFTGDNKNIDTLFASSPSMSSINALINLGYRLNNKLEIGFNIDVIGISFGTKGTPTFISNGKKSATIANPTSPNILLVGDNDKGSLNSQFYVKYEVARNLGIKLAYQYLFNELTTETKVQTSPSANDRFRFKSNMVFAGISYSF
jgi:long-subunit fatty acid transport protein